MAHRPQTACSTTTPIEISDAAKWALMKKEAKRIAPPRKTTPAPRVSRAKEKLRKSARHRHDSAVPTLDGTTPPVGEQPAATDLNASDQQSRLSFQPLIRTHEVERESSAWESLVSARGQTTANDVESDSTTNDGKDLSEPMAKVSRPSIEDPRVGMMTTHAQKRKREVTEDQPWDIDLQGSDHHWSKRARVLHTSETIGHGQQEPSSTAAEDTREGMESAQVPDANITPAMPNETSSQSTFASGRKRDGAGGFQGNQDTVLGSSGTARVSKTRSKKRSR